eukprot:TRINITY_DN39_c0_g1_i1.p1 TRINITY_DN39_c0_g1~~TRINITY_DN39_c0_g1_i1.p1  ORF type:complete len:428 (+),score=92.07 TRINITY_DN39_c0_g1_i1:100-1284(+)
MQSEKNEKIPVFSTYKEQTYEFDLSTPPSYANLLEQLSTRFCLEKTMIYTQYLDEEKDEIRFSTDDELSYALSLVSVPLRISVREKPELLPIKEEDPLYAELLRIRLFKRQNPQTQEEWFGKIKHLDKEGHSNLRLNLRLMNKLYNGDLAPVLAKLEERNKSAAKRKNQKNNPARLAKKRFVELCKKFDFLKELPDNAKALYLDGNNMIYVDNEGMKVRYRQWRKEAQDSLISACPQILSEFPRLEKLVLVFDRLGKHAINAPLDPRLEARGLRPGFASADDDLVDLAKTAPSDSVFVTSDRELIGRLIDSKVKWVMRSKTWVTFAKRIIAGKSKVQPEKEEIVKKGPIREEGEMEKKSILIQESKEEVEDVVEKLGDGLNDMELSGPLEVCEA